MNALRKSAIVVGAVGLLSLPLWADENPFNPGNKGTKPTEKKPDETKPEKPEDKEAKVKTRAEKAKKQLENLVLAEKAWSLKNSGGEIKGIYDLIEFLEGGFDAIKDPWGNTYQFEYVTLGGDKALRRCIFSAVNQDIDKRIEYPETTRTRVAHIKVSGSLDETPVDGESLFGGGGESLTMLIERIDKAAKDNKVKALYVELGSLECGFGKINEVRTAIEKFKKTGKKAYAYSEELSTKAYILALSCDGISLPESGGLELYGLRAEVMFYKEAFKLLDVKADVLKMGKYKSAVEPYLADKMSDENREQIKSMMDDNFDREIVANIVAGRGKKKFTAKQVEEIIDQGPFTAKKAEKLGLIDGLHYQDEFETHFSKALGVDSVKVEKNYGKTEKAGPDMSNPLALLDMLSPKKKAESKADKIAVIHIIGGIESGKGSVNPLMGGSTVGSDTIVAAIREAEKNPTVKAIVLRVDSPGGSALASDIMWRELKICKKPVVASMGDVAASGGYYVCMNAKKIFAEPGTITGSIGVFGMKLVTGGLYAKAGLKTEVVSRGKNSGVGSSTFEWSESERKAMTETIEEVYATFLNKATEGRVAAGQKAMTREKLESLAGGRVWTGRQAKENGLVDELGTLNDAIAYAKKEAGLPADKTVEMLNLPKGAGFFEKLMEGGLPFGLKAELKLIPGAEKALQHLAPFLGNGKSGVRMALPYTIEWK
jgi:protease IV